jgi:hypothetical protein
LINDVDLNSPLAESLSPSNIIASLPTVGGATSLFVVSNMMSSPRQNHATVL